MKNYVYTWIRTDLPIEQQIVQAAHSALEAGRSHHKPQAVSHLILLEAKSEDHLCRIAEDLDLLGIAHHMFFEPDYDRGYTSITTEPLYTKEQRKYFFKHNLYKFQPTHSMEI